MNIIVDGPEERTFECADDDTLLRAALRAGLGFPYACNVGSCGNCRFQLIEGEVEHARKDPPAWSERDLKRARYLGCQALPHGDCRIKLRLDEMYVPQHKPIRTPAKLTDKIPLTHDITEFVFALEKPSEFLPGQYALIEVPGVEGGRAYSMCNVSGRDGEWRFQIKRVPGGAATTSLFDQVSSGDTVNVDGPYGTAYLREEAPRDILCLAGGSGLSPVMSIARAAMSSEKLQGRRLDFIYGGRQVRDICGGDMLAELPGFGERLFFHPAISSPGAEDSEWEGHTGFVHEVAQKLFGDSLKEREIYFAGPPAMAAAIQKMLVELKVPFEQVHFDEFY